MSYKPGYRFPGRLIGRILTDGEFIRYRDLELALEEQKKTNRMLGETLVHMGLLDPMDLRAVLSVNEHLADLKGAIVLAAGVRSLLGDLLVRARHITAEQLELALLVQKRTGERLGEISIRLGLITDSELDAVLQFQQNQEIEGQAPGRLRIGELLVKTGRISRSQLEDALSQQRLSKKKIGEILVDAGYISRPQLSHGLSLQRKLITAALAAVLSLAPWSGSHAAGSSRDAMPERTATEASAQTLTSLKILSQTSELVVTHTDVLRGYVDIPVGAKIEIENTNLAGYLVLFEGLEEPFKEVVVKGLGKDALIRRDGGWVVQPYHGRDPLSVELGYRFILSENALPGTYAWPLKISVSPIIQV
jgi:hypothetical protein